MFSQAANNALKLRLPPSTSITKKLQARSFLVKATMLGNRFHWASAEAHVEAHLLKSLPTSPPPIVAEPLRDLVSAAPRSIAPVLCLAACELIGSSRDQAVDAACAIHLMHAAAWSHDRLLGLLGGGDLEYPANIALLTGDLIVPLAYEIVARNAGLDPDLALRVVVEIAEAMGAAGFVEGQLARAQGTAGSEWVSESKEGRLGACAAACGAILGGADDEDVERMRRLGRYAGTMEGLLRGEDVRAKEFRDGAIEELEDFEEGKRTAMKELVEIWFEEGMKKRLPPPRLEDRAVM